MKAALLRHFLLTVRLNFRSPAAVAYGYLMPVLFLVAFGTIFQTDTPPLQHELGQILTITLLGGACFGMPTALVAERERGVWRRYLLLPLHPSWLLLNVLLARLVLVAGATVLQLGLARLIYGTPLPVHPLELVVAFFCVMGALMGLGLIIAALAPDVPAVQGLGQCLFLPMILIGGVGVPLAALPTWARMVAAFMPGRYAVELLQSCTGSGLGLRGAGFSLMALLFMGAAAGLAGLRLFRGGAERASGQDGRGWLALALVAWIAVGVVACWTGRSQSVDSDVVWEAVTDAQLAAISYADLPADTDIVTRVSRSFELEPAGASRVQEFSAALRHWAPAQVPDKAQAVRNLLSVASIADLAQDRREGEISRVVFNQLLADIPREQLRRILGWVILNPQGGSVVTDLHDLGIRRRPSESAIRLRNEIFARKLLGRMLGRLPD